MQTSLPVDFVRSRFPPIAPATEAFDVRCCAGVLGKDYASAAIVSVGGSEIESSGSANSRGAETVGQLVARRS